MPATVAGPVESDLRKLDENEVRDRNEAAQQRATLDNELKEGERALKKQRDLVDDQVREEEARAGSDLVEGVVWH